MKKWIWLIIIAVIIAGGSGWFLAHRAAEKKADAKKEAPRVRRVEAASALLRKTVESTGEIRPQNRLEVKPPISGRIEEVLFEEGDTITKGDIVAWLSSTERATLLDAARAQGEEAVKYWSEIYKTAPLIAPLSGTVIARAVEPGQTVNSGNAVLVIADRLMVVGQVDETDIGLITGGQQVDVRLDAYPDILFSGRVQRIAYDSKMVSNITMYEVDIMPTNLPVVARSGMTATLTFILTNKEVPVAIPTAAVQYEEGRPFVEMPNPNGQPRKQEIETGLSDGEQIEIVSGLNVGDLVLIPKVSFNDNLDKTNPFMPFGNKKKSSGKSKGR